MQLPTSSELFDTSRTIAGELIDKYEYPWQVLPHISEFIISLGKTLDSEKFYSPSENVWIAKTAAVAPTAAINPPCIIDEGAEIRHCAYIRGNVIIGKNSVVGNSTEMKNAIIFDSVQIPHFNYCGDSILGYRAHMAAGVITSNVKSDKTNVTLKLDGEKVETGLRKFGAMVGDYVEIGCNSVLNPGTVVGRRTNIYPLSRVRGYVPPDSIYKSDTDIVQKY